MLFFLLLVTAVACSTDNVEETFNIKSQINSPEYVLSLDRLGVVVVINQNNPPEPTVINCHTDWNLSVGRYIVTNPSGTRYLVHWNDYGDTTPAFEGATVYQSTFNGRTRTYSLINITNYPGFDCN